MARDRLALAAAAVEIGHPEGAVSAAYYAMLYAARAACSTRARPKREDPQRDVEPLFAKSSSYRAVSSQSLPTPPRPYSDSEKTPSYDAASIPADDANDVIALARRFVGAVEDLLAG